MRVKRLVFVAVGVSLAASLVGVAEFRPARLAAGTSNTIVVNSTKPVWLDVQIESVTGRVLPQSDVRYTWVGGDRVELSSDGRVSCARRADARIGVAGGALRAELTVRCRPVATVAFTPGLRLVSGGASQSLPLTAFGADGQRVAVWSPHVRVGGDSVVTLNGLVVKPDRAGIAWADVSLGDCIETIEIAVDDSVSSVDSLRTPYRAFTAVLKRGETQRWQLPAGRYELSWSDENEEALIQPPNGASCVPERGGGKRYECMLRLSSTVTVHGAGGSASNSNAGVLSIRRLADSTAARAMAIARIKRRIDSRTVDCPVVGDRK